MTGPFDLFVIFAEMRTGSNLLEDLLGHLDGVCCHGEAFNPHFLGHPNQKSLIGMDQTARDRDPHALLERLRRAPGQLAGFRYFHDHDPRILDALLDDPRCAKIVLTRSPVDSYVSLKIARATEQWKLTDAARRKMAKTRFDAAEFAAYLAPRRAFLERLRAGLQRRGQTAFSVDYDDLHDPGVLSGLARWLGVPADGGPVETGLHRQNPEPLAEKVENFGEMTAALAEFEGADPWQVPDLEPRRGAGVPRFICAARAALLYMPIPGGPDAAIRTWLAALDDVTPEALHDGFTRKTLRAWMRAHPGHRRFAVLRHPLARAYGVFRAKLLGPHADARLRKTLRDHHGVAMPQPGLSFSESEERQAFLAFLEFLKRNLRDQTALPVMPDWASQSAFLHAMSEVAPPDLLLREETLEATLPRLAESLGLAPQAFVPAPETCGLARLYDKDVEDAARAAYPRDYLLLGFEDWAASGDQAALTRSASVRIV